MSILISGDSHGCFDHICFVTQTAAFLGCKAVIQLGDFGYWPHTNEGVSFLDSVEKHLDLLAELSSKDISIYFIDGNHDYQPELFKLQKQRGGNPLEPLKIRERLFWLPRGSTGLLSGANVLFLGGSYSIDKAIRVPGFSWWPEEQTRQQDIDQCLTLSDIDIVLAHDCPTAAEIGLGRKLRLSAVAESTFQRKLLQQVQDHLRPHTWVHGHYHINYEYSVDGTRFVGLSSEMTAGRNLALLNNDGEIINLNNFVR